MILGGLAHDLEGHGPEAGPGQHALVPSHLLQELQVHLGRVLLEVVVGAEDEGVAQQLEEVLHRGHGVPAILGLDRDVHEHLVVEHRLLVFRVVDVDEDEQSHGHLHCGGRLAENEEFVNKNGRVILMLKYSHMLQDPERISCLCVGTGELLDSEMKVEVFHGEPGGLQALAALTNKEDDRIFPIELAVQKFLAEQSVEECDVVRELGFDPRKKYSAVISSGNLGEKLAVWGAPDELYPRLNVSDEMMTELKKEHADLMSQGLQVLLVGERPWNRGILDDSALNNLIPLGFVGLHRKLLATKIPENVRVLILSADHEDTVRHIAAELGLSTGEDSIIAKPELDQMSDDDLFGRLSHVSVFSRLFPEDKTRVVHALIKMGYVV